MTTTTREVEIKISAPPEFDGDRDESEIFLLNCNVYLDINDKIYNTDKKKVIFALSYMTKGNAAAWKEDFMTAAEDLSRKNTAGTVIGYGDWISFKAEFRDTFGTIDPARTAMTKIRNLKQNGDLQTYVTEYCILAHKAGMKEHAPRIEFFCKGLNRGLHDQLNCTGETLNDFDTVVNTCINLDNAFQHLRAIQRRENPQHQQKKNWGNHSYTSRRDNDAMEVDRLTDKEKEEHMHTGK